MSKQPTINLIETLFDQSKAYAKNRFDLYKLKAADKTASLASAVITAVVLFVVFFIFFVVLNIGIGLLLGDLLGKASWGFLLLAAIYAIAGFVLFSARNKVFKTPVTKMIFKKFL